jgi:hypothetical protein
MKIFNPVIVGSIESRETASSPGIPANPHDHANLPVLNRITVDQHGVLLFDGKPVDTVGQQFVNAAILEQFTVDNGKLYFAGSPVDTVGSVFSNETVLRMFSTDQNGELLFNGQPIKSTGSSLPNAEDLKRLAIDENNQLTVDGVVVSGSGGQAVTLSVTKLGSGTALIKSVVGTDIQTRSLVAGANVTLDVSGDEVKINASLNGSVSASSTFKSSDGYSGTQVLAGTAATQILAFESPTDETGLLFLARLGSDAKATIKDIALPSVGSVIPNTASPLARNLIATAFANGKLSIPNGTTYSASSPATWFAGTVDWTIEFDFVRSSANQGAIQVMVGGLASTSGIANSSVWCGFTSANVPYVGVGIGSAATYMYSPTAITDTNKHHIEVNRSASVLRLFVDGVLVISQALTGSLNAGTGFSIGSALDATSPFYGALRDVKVYNYAKHTSAYTVDSYFKGNVGVLSRVDMTGKLMSSQFWKQVSSLSVVSTETATAYLKWLMVDATGYNVWDSANKVWVAADIANIASVGMTTTEVKAAFLNNPWNYRSDTVGFAVALVTTDGASSPVLTSVTLAAVQSADKTAGHAVLDGSGVALPQRTSLKFEDLVVSDDGTHTVVKGSAAEVAALQGQVTSLQQQSGKVGGYAVDVSSPQNGSVLAYDSAKNSFVAAVAAQGAAGNGLHMTDVVSLAPGAEALVTHQRVSQGRAIYQAEEFLAAGAASNARSVGFDPGLVSAAPIQGQSLRAQRQGYRLPFQFNSIVKNAMKTLPQATSYPDVFEVDGLVYIMAGRLSSTTTTTAIQTAPHDDPTTVTKIASTTDVSYMYVNSCVDILRFGDYLYRIGEQVVTGASVAQNPTIKRAHISDPTSWSAIGAMAVPLYWSARFVVGQYLYYVGGVANNVITANIYRSPLSDLTQMEQVGTFAGSYLYASTFYQYGDYLYILGGRSGSSAATSTTLTNKIWRAHVSDPTAWTQIGTFPVVEAYTGCGVVGDRVIIGGVRTGSDGSAYSTSAWMSDASNPVSWSTLTALNSAIAGRGSLVVDDTYCLYGGANASAAGSTQIDSYTLTFNNTASRAIVYTEDYSLDSVQSITSVNLDAKIPAGTSIRAMASFDMGATWKYWSGSAWTEAPLTDASFDLCADISTSVPGVSGVFDYPTVRFAFQLKSTITTLTPRLYAVRMNYVEAGSMMPLSVGGFNSYTADIGVKHRQGSYQATSVKNLTNRSLSLVLKVYDGAL